MARYPNLILCALLPALSLFVGCAQLCRPYPTCVLQQLPEIPVPTEENKAVLSSYIVETPDILLVELINPIHKPPYRIKPNDFLRINVTGAPEFAPLKGDYAVQPHGTIDLGEYGSLEAINQTVDELKSTIGKQVTKRFPEAIISVDVGLLSTAPPQAVTGPHLVRPDGTIGLGTYGSANVAGMSLAEINDVITKHLSDYFLDPQVNVDVISYNSKVYYIILDNAGAGQTVHRLPFTGNETVLDAMSFVGGLTPVSDDQRIWINRPVYSEGNPTGEAAILPVSWNAIVHHGDASANYQIMPGDRIYLDSQAVDRLDTVLAKVISPIERVLGVTLLGSTTYNSIAGRATRTNF